jgi:hypothetical protein
MKRHALIIAALGCTACTSVDVTRVDPARPSSRVGISHPLAFTQYRIQLTRQVVGCGNQMKLSAGAKIEETRAAADPLHRFVIDPNSLSSPFKTSEIKAEYHPNGLVKTLNATADDKTGEVIANIGSIGVKIATLAAGVGAAGPGGPEACHPDVVAALTKVATQKEKVKDATAAVEARTAQLKAIKEKIVTLGAAVNERSRDDLSTALDLLAEATDTQKREARTLAKLMEPLSHTETILWPANGDVGRGAFPFDRSVVRRWQNPATPGDDDPAELGKLDIFVQIISLSDTARILRTERPRPATAGTADPTTPPDTVVPRLGIPYRQPDYGQLRICSASHCDEGGDELAEQRGNILQLGYVYYLPCQSRPFTSISCSYELAEDGWLKSMGTAQRQAAAVGATGAAGALLDSATSIHGTLAGDDLADMKARTDALKAEAELRAAQKALEDQPVDPNAATRLQTTALQANVELAHAEKALLEAEAELADARRVLRPDGN